MNKQNPIPNDLTSQWMPFTPNRQFHKRPRLVSAAKDMHYFAADDGRAILDGSGGLWCANAGHCREPIVKAIADQAAELDYAPPFNFGHPKAFELASKVAAMAPEGLNHVQFTNSGSEGADTALKIALNYHVLKGEGTRTKLVGRERGYHGVGFGGISVGGMVKNRESFGPGLPGVAHMRHTATPENASCVGEPDQGAELAEDLERLVALNGPKTIAAVIVEPMAGSTGVLPPPKGYLKRLREICDAYGIILIFDEVITGFGRLGANFAAERFGVTPDIITCAKGLTSGTVPMGGVIVSEEIYQTFMTGPEHAIEFFHGYTYSGHPLAAAAGLATLELYEDEGVFANAQAMEKPFAAMATGVKDHDLVKDVRVIGLAAAIDLVPGDAPGKRGLEAIEIAFHEENIMIRQAADSLVFSPPLILTEEHIAEMGDKLTKVLSKLSR